MPVSRLFGGKMSPIASAAPSESGLRSETTMRCTDAERVRGKEGIMFRSVFLREVRIVAVARRAADSRRRVGAQSAITGLVRGFERRGASRGHSRSDESGAHRARTRGVVTDAQGRYTVLDLRPGVYKVTFTLTGFKTIIQDAINLPSNFTATVNAGCRSARWKNQSPSPASHRRWTSRTHSGRRY